MKNLFEEHTLIMEIAWSYVRENIFQRSVLIRVLLSDALLGGHTKEKYCKSLHFSQLLLDDLQFLSTMKESHGLC